MKEKRLLQKYFDEISQDTGKYCFMVEDTLRALDLGAIETLIIWENLDVQRYELRNTSTQEIEIKHLNAEQEKNDTFFKDSSTGVELEVVTKESLVEVSLRVGEGNELEQDAHTAPELITNSSTAPPPPPPLHSGWRNTTRTLAAH